MDLKSAKAELKRLKIIEDQRTSDYIKLAFKRNSLSLDLSNHCIFKSSLKLISKLLETKPRSYKYITLKNCMLSPQLLQKLLIKFHKRGLKIQYLDIANNRLQISESLALSISSVLKTVESSLIIQGNIMPVPQALSDILAGPLLELNLYDCNITDEHVNVISFELARGKVIRKLNLAFNSETFASSEVVSNFALAVSANVHIEHLDLSGIDNLGESKLIQVLSLYITGNRSLRSLSLACINLGDTCVAYVSDLLAKTPVFEVNLQNNCITDSGICELLGHLSDSVSSLDLSYNEIRDSSSLVAIAEVLLSSRSLRNLNISHTLELEEINEEEIDKFCHSITKNDSLTDFLCEGVKISDNPDTFCQLVNEAIAARKLSLTYKISAVNCNDRKKSSILRNLSLSDTRMDWSQEITHESNRPTEKREYPEVFNGAYFDD